MGRGDSLIFKNQFSDRVYSVNVMPSIDGNYSYEVLAGTRNSIVACLSGGADDVTGFEVFSEIPNEFELYQNYPNPFNPSTKIKFTIPAGAPQVFTLRVYDVLGNEVATLVNEEKPAGVYEVEFDASMYSSGIYIYQIRAGSFIDVKKMILLK